MKKLWKIIKNYFSKDQREFREWYREYKIKEKEKNKKRRNIQ